MKFKPLLGSYWYDVGVATVIIPSWLWHLISEAEPFERFGLVGADWIFASLGLSVLCGLLVWFGARTLLSLALSSVSRPKLQKPLSGMMRIRIVVSVLVLLFGFFYVSTNEDIGYEFDFPYLFEATKFLDVPEFVGYIIAILCFPILFNALWSISLSTYRWIMAGFNNSDINDEA